MKSRGPKTEPCGTPQFNRQTDDLSPQNTTAFVLSVRNDLIQWRMTPPMPKDDCRRWRRMSWSTVSNAALRSRSPTSETSPESAASRMGGWALGPSYFNHFSSAKDHTENILLLLSCTLTMGALQGSIKFNPQQVRWLLPRVGDTVQIHLNSNNQPWWSQATP